MICIRPMEEKDLDAVVRIEYENFSRPWNRAGFGDSIFRSDTIYLAAEENGRVLGYVGMWIALDEGEITNVSVARTSQGQGIGRKLLVQLLREAFCSGVQRCILEVRKSNERAIGLYESLGFAGIGIRKNFYEDPVEDGIVMETKSREDL